MKIKFANGVEKECTSPIEQKAFKNISEKSIGSGWILNLKLIGLITSTELDNLLSEDNIKSLEFSYTSDDDEDISLFKLDGYEKVTSSVIRYSEDTNTAYTEIQLSRGF
jgi:hypothetical protein